MSNDQPLVSVITPVYNCEKYLAECIESVLAQTYRHWHYVIVDNRSTDRSAAIAAEYAARDSRITLLKCDEFVPVVANHNRAIRQTDANAKYCKFIFADDWLYPTCIEQMVALAEANPSVGLVGAYGTDGEHLLWTGVHGRQFEILPPYLQDVVGGHDISRATLLGRPYVFGSTGSLLIRADLIRKREAFFNERNLHADYEACLDVLQESDFGFVHQLLTYYRPRPQSEGAFAKDFNSVVLGNFVILMKFGPVYLSAEEYGIRHKELEWQYHLSLARNVLRLRSKEFWDYHKRTLDSFGSDINRSLLVRAILVQIAYSLTHPHSAVTKVINWWGSALKRISTKV